MPVKPIPEGYNNVIPFLICKDAQKVIEFAQKTFGATVDDIAKSPDGYVMHASIHIRDSAIMLSDGSEKFPVTSTMMYIYVDNVDEVYKKGLAAGGESLREPTDEFYGDRSCGLKDVSGNQWWVASHVEDVSDEEMAKRQKEAQK
jgi:PhnB protein